MSPLRSRSGGTWTVTTCRRNANGTLKQRRAGKPERLRRRAKEIRDGLQLGKIVGLKFHTQVDRRPHDPIHG